MNPRLIRSLQRGGLVAKLIEPGWGVWRGRDRRHRMIGTLTGAEIDLLRLYECLRCKPLSQCQAMYWRVPSAHSTMCINDLMASYADPAKARSCLDQIILTHASQAERKKLADTARAFRRDALSGVGDPAAQEEACERLGLVVATLSARDCRFTYDLLISRETNLTLAKSYDCRPDAIKTKAIATLRRLAITFA